MSALASFVLGAALGVLIALAIADIRATRSERQVWEALIRDLDETRATLRALRETRDD